jgi:RNase P/RNase MRP subunit p29
MKLTNVLFIILVLSLLVGCTQKISDIKNEEYVGKEVSIRGTVQGTIKLGKLSGYTLVDGDGNKIGVSSESLPAEGSTITVKGTLIKGPLLGYYIKAD